jgi:hypothetical protein
MYSRAELRRHMVCQEARQSTPRCPIFSRLIRLEPTPGNDVIYSKKISEPLTDMLSEACLQQCASDCRGHPPGTHLAGSHCQKRIYNTKNCWVHLQTMRLSQGLRFYDEDRRAVEKGVMPKRGIQCSVSSGVGTLNAWWRSVPAYPLNAVSFFRNVALTPHSGDSPHRYSLTMLKLGVP